MVVKDSKDHRMSFYHGFLYKKRYLNKIQQKVKNDETLNRLESWQKGLGVLRSPLFHA